MRQEFAEGNQTGSFKSHLERRFATEPLNRANTATPYRPPSNIFHTLFPSPSPVHPTPPSSPPTHRHPIIRLPSLHRPPIVHLLALISNPSRH